MVANLFRQALVSLGFVKHPMVTALKPKIAFYVDAAVHGNHGKIVVTNHAYGLKQEAVNFVFVGRREPPAMSLEVIQEIWKQAAAQGYYPIEIAHYGVPKNAMPMFVPAAATETDDLSEPLSAPEVFASNRQSVEG